LRPTSPRHWTVPATQASLPGASFGLPKRKVIGALASLDTSEYELQHDTAAAGLGIQVSALDKLVKRWRAATKKEDTALTRQTICART